MANLRTLSMAAIVACTVYAPAQACPTVGHHHTVLFQDITGLQAPIILRATITRMLNDETPKPGSYFTSEEYAKRFTLVGHARVEEVIKGEVAERVIRVAVLPSSCGPGLQAGMSGIIAGTMTRDERGMPVLHLASESEAGRYDRLRGAGKP